jgi:hypothetical protein
MRGRSLVTLGVAAVALVAARCEKRASDSRPAQSVAASPAPPSPGSISGASPSPASSASGSLGERPSDCQRKHWDNPWRPLQTNDKPLQSVACSDAGCVSIDPVVSKGDRCPNRCRRVTITPRVSASDAAREARIQTLLDAQVADVTGDDCWLLFLDYSIHHDSNGILDVSFRMSGLGAYPSTQTAHVTVDLETGSRLRAADVFSPRTLPELTRAMNGKLLTAWRRATQEHAEVFRGREAPRFGREHLDDFIVHAEGITFFFDYGLPHALELAMPASEFLWTKRDIARFIDPKGPLRLLRDSH